MLHRIAATSLPPRGHGISLEGIEKEYFTTIVVHEVIVCLNTIFRCGHVMKIDNQMPIFGDQVSIPADELFNRIDIFSCSAENTLIKDIGIRKDSLLNHFLSASESHTIELIGPFPGDKNIVPPPGDHVASIQLACAAYRLGLSCQSNNHTTLAYSS